MAQKYTDLSNFKIRFDPFTHFDKRWEKIFNDEYARVIFAGYRLKHVIDLEGLDTLMKESMLIADEIRKKKTIIEKDSLKKRLWLMYDKINGLTGGNKAYDVPDDFVDYILPYLKKEKNFGYKIIKK